MKPLIEQAKNFAIKNVKAWALKNKTVATCLILIAFGAALYTGYSHAAEQQSSPPSVVVFMACEKVVLIGAAANNYYNDGGTTVITGKPLSIREDKNKSAFMSWLMAQPDLQTASINLETDLPDNVNIFCGRQA